MTQKPIPILLDCDPGHDDAIAILMALRSPDIRLLGITTVCGNSYLENTTRNALRILEFANRRDVPVAKGCHRPLTRELVLGTADGHSGLDGSTYLPEPTMAVQPIHAVDFLAKVLEKAEEPVTLVPTGPLTNIALFLLRYPHLKSRIKQVCLMGGVFYRPNDYFTFTEFNIVCDPEAAKIVVNSGLDVTMVGLDVTMKVLVEQAEFEALGKIDTPMGRLVLDWLKFYEQLHRRTMGVGGALHDPLALAAIIDPSLIVTKEVYLDIETSGTVAHGATVADFWGERGKKPNARIAVQVDSARFFTLLFDLLGSKYDS